jgi:glyoxalase-like protein
MAAVRVEFDHLVVACADLSQGAEWMRAQLGVEVLPGGKHAAMGTHNRLLRLGPRTYLEVLAIDPAAPAPRRPRWFDLDSAAVRARAAKEPFVLTWVVRADDIVAAAAEAPVLGEVLPFTRGRYRWRLTVPVDGALRFDGILPAVIQWDVDQHPADALPDSRCELLGLSLTHPQCDEVRTLFARLGVPAAIDLERGAPRIAAHVGALGTVRLLA